MAEIGHNQPDLTQTAGEVSKDLSDWLSEHPVVASEEEAREGKLLIDRASLCVKDMEDERKSKTDPLNKQVAEINNYYRAPRELLQGVVNELKRRFDSFLLREEEKRIAAAQEAARIAAAAEQAAREAERKEQEAFAEADAGVAGLDVASLTAEADHSFSQAQKAARDAARAERDTKVKIGGGFRRALGLRNKETLYVDNAELAVATLGATDDIVEAILKSARAYRKLHNKLPSGVSADFERKS